MLTRDLIFEAALKLLETEGLDRFTTNRLAEISGYSVGTIYQYFEDKRAVLAALGERETERALAALRSGLAAQSRSLATADAEERIRAALRVALGAFGGRLKARRLLVQAALRSGRTDILDRPVNTMIGLLQSPGIARADGPRRVLHAEEAFVLAHAVMGADPFGPAARAGAAQAPGLRGCAGAPGHRLPVRPARCGLRTPHGRRRSARTIREADVNAPGR